MDRRTTLIALVVSGAMLGVGGAGRAQVTTPVPRAQVREQAVGTVGFSRAVYDGHRASRLLGSAVFSLKGEYLGKVSNVVLADSGQIVSLLVEGAESRDEPEFISRISWTRIMQPFHTGALIADFSDMRSREFGLFFDPDQQKKTNEFVISKIIGDYARLQSGQGFGYVSDLVFDQSGKLAAVVVSREASAGGGTYAFPYPGTTGRWSPEMSYYGLPYVTANQASEAGLRIDLQRFRQT